MTAISQHAVLARIEVSEEGVTLILEDVKGNGTTWKLDALFTSKLFPRDEFLEVNMTHGQLEDVGLNLVSRLAVFYEAWRKRDATKPE